MRFSILILFFITLTSCNLKKNYKNDSSLKYKKYNESKIKLPNSNEVLVLRTDFSDDKKWNNICNIISQPSEKFGFKANVNFLSDKHFENLKKEQLLDINNDYKHLFIFVVDSLTINHKDIPILCVYFNENIGKSFRVIPIEIQSVENNISISNMDFMEFFEYSDKEGIFRGFD